MTIVETMKSRFTETGRKLGYHDDKQGVTWIEWSAIAVITVLCFLAFHFIDMDSILDNTVLFIHSITDGKFFDFYKYSIEHASTGWSANYEMPVYILFAIWNFPTIITGYFTEVNYTQDIICILWAKFMLMVFVAASAYMIYKIANYAGLNKPRSRFASYLFVSSAFVVMFTNVVPQMDIMPIFFMLVGMYFYIKNDMRAFVIAFAIAIPLKMFAIFVFVPLVLLKIKSVIKIIGYLVSGMSIQLLCKLIFINSVEYKYATSSNTKGVISRLLNGNIAVSTSRLSIFLVIVVAACIYCYAVRREEKNDIIRLTCYIPFLIFSSMFIFFETNTYWSILLAPFMILSIILTPNRLKLNLFLETGAAVSFVFHCFCYSKTFTLVKETYDVMLLNTVFPAGNGMQRRYDNVKVMLGEYKLTGFDGIVFCVFAVCLFALLITCYPRKNTSEIGNTEKIEYSVIFARLTSLVLILGILTYSYLAVANNPVINTTTANVVISSEINVTDRNTVVSQEFVPKREIVATELTLRFYNEATHRKNMGNVTISIKNDKGDSIYSVKQGTSLISNKKDFIINLKNIKLENGEKYTVEITGKNNNNIDPICPMVVRKKMHGVVPASVNGVKQNYSLYIKVR